MNLIHRIIFRLSPEDKQQLTVAAKEERLTVSKYLRKIVREAIWQF